MKRFALLAVLLFSGGCSASRYAMQDEIREALYRSETAEALKIAESDDFYTDDESILLRHLELGNLHYLNGSYYQALKHFDAARLKSKELYTRSLSNTAASAVAGSWDDYAGEAYELSLLRFYQSLCHYHLYLNGRYEAFTDRETGNAVPEKILTEKEKRMHLMAARAVVVDWDALLKEFQSQKAGEVLFKQDLAAKLWGGFIHEENGSSEDRQISRQLYKDAGTVLFRNYNLYPAYNLKYRDFAGQFPSLHEKNEKEIESELISATPKSEALKTYAKTALKNMNSNKKPNVFIVLKTGRIARKKAERVSFPVPLAVSDKSFANMISSGLLSFELPAFDDKEQNADVKIAFVKPDGGKTVAEKTPALLDPVSQIAVRDLNTARPAVYAAKAARLTVKYIAALAAARAIYEKHGAGWAQLTFATSLLLIEASEQADLRYWSTLPESIWMQSFRLPAGDYEMRVSVNGNALHSQKITVPAKGVVFKDLNL